MSEKNELEKWERKNWYLFPSDYKPGLSSRSTARSRALSYSNIIVNDEQISIGDFSIKYVNIVRLEKDKHYYLIIHCVNERNYRLLMSSQYGKAIIKARDKLFSVLTEKLKQFEKIKITHAETYIKNLPNLYKEISLDDLTSRTGVERPNLMNLIESLVSNGEIEAEISGNKLKLRKEPDIAASPKGYGTTASTIQESQRKEGLLIFASYATKDAELYKISELAHKLESYKEIGEVLYWQEDMHDSIIEYMNDNLGKCDVMLLFCSPNALESVPVKKEWMAAEAVQKPIIPIFFKPEHIPTLLSDRLGIEFNNFDFKKTIQEIFELILKKKQG